MHGNSKGNSAFTVRSGTINPTHSWLPAFLAKGKHTDRKPTEKTPYHATTYYSIFPSRQILPRRNNDLTTYSRTVTMFDKPWAKSNISCTHPEETLAGYCCQNKHDNNVLALLSRCRTISSCLEQHLSRG